MNDIHIRAILLMVIAAMSIGGAVGVKLVASAASTGPSLLLIVALVSFVAAIYMLLFVEGED